MTLGAFSLLFSLALVPDHSVAFFAVVCYSNWPKSSARKSATIQEFP